MSRKQRWASLESVRDARPLRGKAFQLLSDFKASLSGAGAPFMMSRLILRARVIPEQITEDLDDPAVEQRLSDAIAALDRERNTPRIRS